MQGNFRYNTTHQKARLFCRRADILHPNQRVAVFKVWTEYTMFAVSRFSEQRKISRHSEYVMTADHFCKMILNCCLILWNWCGATFYSRVGSPKCFNRSSYRKPKGTYVFMDSAAYLWTNMSVAVQFLANRTVVAHAYRWCSKTRCLSSAQICLWYQYYSTFVYQSTDKWKLRCELGPGTDRFDTPSSSKHQLSWFADAHWHIPCYHDRM